MHPWLRFWKVPSSMKGSRSNRLCLSCRQPHLLNKLLWWWPSFAATMQTAWWCCTILRKVRTCSGQAARRSSCHLQVLLVGCKCFQNATSCCTRSHQEMRVGIFNIAAPLCLKLLLALLVPPESLAKWLRPSWVTVLGRKMELLLAPQSLPILFMDFQPFLGWRCQIPSQKCRASLHPWNWRMPSPAIPLHVDCSGPATCLSRLSQSGFQSSEMSHASLTPVQEGLQSFASCFCLQQDASEDPCMVGGSSNMPSAASIGSTFGAIRRHTTIDLDPDEPAKPLPEPATPEETYWHLLNVGVPVPIAREAARRYLHDLDAALDWACSSDRRHTCPALDSTDLMDVVDSSSEAGSGHVIGSPIALAPSSSLTGPNPSASRPSVSSVALNECVGSPVVPSVPTVSRLSAMPAPSFWLPSVTARATCPKCRCANDCCTSLWWPVSHANFERSSGHLGKMVFSDCKRGTCVRYHHTAAVAAFTSGIATDHLANHPIPCWLLCSCNLVGSIEPVLFSQPIFVTCFSDTWRRKMAARFCLNCISCELPYLPSISLVWMLLPAARFKWRSFHGWRVLERSIRRFDRLNLWCDPQTHWYHWLGSRRTCNTLAGACSTSGNVLAFAQCWCPCSHCAGSSPPLFARFGCRLGLGMFLRSKAHTPWTW